MIRVVVDTNTLVSGFLWSGKPGQLIDAAFAESIKFIATEALFAEAEDVFSRPKFIKHFERIKRTPAQVLENYHQLAELVQPADVPTGAVRDPKDVPVLACAVGGHADYIVSGDSDLLDLAQFQEIPIITVARCLELLSE